MAEVVAYFALASAVGIWTQVKNVRILDSGLNVSIPLYFEDCHNTIFFLFYLFHYGWVQTKLNLVNIFFLFHPLFKNVFSFQIENKKRKKERKFPSFFLVFNFFSFFFSLFVFYFELFFVSLFSFVFLPPLSPLPFHSLSLFLLFLISFLPLAADNFRHILFLTTSALLVDSLSTIIWMKLRCACDPQNQRKIFFPFVVQSDQRCWQQNLGTHLWLEWFRSCYWTYRWGWKQHDCRKYCQINKRTSKWTIHFIAIFTSTLDIKFAKIQH